MKRAGCTDTHVCSPHEIPGTLLFCFPLVLRKPFWINTILARFVLAAALAAFPLCQAGALAEVHFALAGKP